MFLLDQPSPPCSSSPLAMATEFSDQHGDAFNSRKKRKRDFENDDSSSSISPLSSNYLYQLGLPTPTPSSTGSFSELPCFDTPKHSTSSPLSSFTNNPSTSKRHRLTPRPSFSRHVSQLSADRSSFASFPSTFNSLAACHVCCRRPSTMQDLPAYSDCESCHNRTCFICLRKCEGAKCRSNQEITNLPLDSSNAGKNICGNCCIEVGSKGRIWCLECYKDDTEPEIYKPATTKVEAQEESLGRVTDWLATCGADYEGDLNY